MMKLGEQRIAERSAIPRMGASPFDGVAPGTGVVRMARVEVEEACGALGIVGREAADAGKPPQVDGLADGARCAGLCGWRHLEGTVSDPRTTVK